MTTQNILESCRSSMVGEGNTGRKFSEGLTSLTILNGNMFSASAIVIYIAAAKLLFHLLTANRYGIFRDELYYLACARHLDWGYVDHPPAIALLTWISTELFGSSLLGLRFLPALAGAVLVWLTGNITKELGGGRLARVTAALAVAVVPVYLLMHHWR